MRVRTCLKRARPILRIGQLHLAVIAAVGLPLLGYGQSQPDFNAWVSEYYREPGANDIPVWTVISDGTSVTEVSNCKPSVFYGEVSSSDQQVIECTVVTTGSDDDFFGFALGLETGTVTDPSADYLLIDWKQQPQSGSIRGLALSRVTGIPIPMELANHYDDPSNPGGAVEELARGATLGDVPWNAGQEYAFRFEIHPPHLEIFVDDVLEFELCAPASSLSGFFGLYCHSQPETTFSNFLASESGLFRRGDTNNDGAFDLADPIFLLSYMFDESLDLQPACLEACDANDDGTINLADPITMIDSFFQGGGPLPNPYPDCGMDQSAPFIGCVQYTCPCP